VEETSLENLHDPYLLAGMKEAVERIKIAKEK
jgi:single-stranded DNA-specific DHH superfamily exonuclease